MPMYTFHLRTLGAAPVGLEAIELAHDAASFAKAGDLLDEHLSCDHVEVWDGDRPVEDAVVAGASRPTFRAWAAAP